MMTSFLLLLLVATWCLLYSTFVAAEVTVVGSTYATTRQHATASLSVPAEARTGDLLIIFIGGSGRPFRDEFPSGPLPSSGWKEIIRFGPKDINQKAYYKVYREDRSTYDINQGKSIFATMLALRGADATAPIVDAAADGIDTIPEISGGSRAPAVLLEEGGLGIFSFAFDDPLRSIALNTPGASVILSFKAVSGDGMAVFSSSNKNVDGTVGPINVKGTFTFGAGNEVAISMSIRPEMPRGKSTSSSSPSSDPSSQPSSSPSSEPTFSPSHVPSSSPSFEPTTCVAAGEKCELDEDGAPVVPCCSSDITCFMFHGLAGRCIATNEPTLSPPVTESESPSASPSAAPVEPTSEPSSAPSTTELVRDESPMPTAVPTRYPSAVPASMAPSHYRE